MDALQRTPLAVRFEQTATALADSMTLPARVDLDDDEAVLDWATEVIRSSIDPSPHKPTTSDGGSKPHSNTIRYQIF